MKRGSTTFLRMVVIVLGLAVLTLCGFALPAIYREWPLQYPPLAIMRFPVLLGVCATAIPFFIALHQTLKLLSYIDKNTAFSIASIKALENIKYCAVMVGALYVAGMPLIYLMAQSDDAPGLIVIGMIIAVASFSVATFAAVLQKLLQSAIAIKAENDLTV